MSDRHLADTSRIYMELGSVWVKTLARQSPAFTVLSYDPAARRIRARAARLLPAGQHRVVRITTDRGPYELGADNSVLLANGESCRVDELRPGALLRSGVLRNQDGMISVETMYRDIWLHELIEADSQGYQMHLQPRPDSVPDRAQRVLKLEEAGVAPCHRVEIDGTASNGASRHSLLLWPDGTSFGAGIFAF